MCMDAHTVRLRVRDSANGNRKFVLLSKDARLPFVKLTRGDYLDAIGAAITQAYAKEKRRITEARCRGSRISPMAFGCG